MRTYKIPYGSEEIKLAIKTNHKVDLILPKLVRPQKPAVVIIDQAIDHPLSGIDALGSVKAGTKVAIAINDKTRPVPNSQLLSPLFDRLLARGVKPEDIHILIASGTHIPMCPAEYSLIIDSEISKKYCVSAHDCDDNSDLLFVGTSTEARTPVFVNKQFYNADLRIVVGDIEPHHFAGYSGGVKSAAIGLCGRKTINSNHELLTDQHSTVGRYDDNPLRKDIEEIGRMIKVDLALNAVLNEQKEILQVFFGRPTDVMQEGIKIVNQLSQIPIQEKYDLVIASAGGYPKDINLYQSQKAMTHASLFCKEGGTILLAAECREGIGSDGYLEFMKGLNSIQGIVEKFKAQGFSVGPHKAYQIARIIEKHPVYLNSSISSTVLKALLFNSINLSNSEDITSLLTDLPENARIAILPYAIACIPKLLGEVEK